MRKPTNKSNTCEFIAKAREVHGERYGYSSVEYVRALEKVTIICKVHGGFKQTPNNHLRGKGCRACNNSALVDTKEFIRRSVLVHGGKYDYTDTQYLTAQTKVTILCPRHGKFSQIPYSHMQGKGCMKCRGEETSKLKTLSTEHFVTVSSEVHQGRYDYSDTEYVRGHEHVTITCPVHGRFSQNAQSHMRGVGCAKCGTRNTDYNNLYVLTSNYGVKIGVSVDPLRRVRTLKKETPFAVSLSNYWHVDEYDIPFTVEKFLHERFYDLNLNLSGFDGATEWFDLEEDVVCTLISEILGAPAQ